MKSRIVLLLIFLTGLWALVLSRAAYLQLVPDGRLKALQKRQFQTTVTVQSRRGDMLDRNGRELAVSMVSYSLFADPKIIENPKATARFLAKELKLNVRSIEEKIRSRKKRFVWIERQLGRDTKESIAKAKIRGLGFIEESSRVYPNDRLLSHVLGFVGSDGNGLEGLELKYNAELQAARKKVSVLRDARGRPLIVNGQVFNQAPDGADVQLTIDRELQFTLEQELAQTVEDHEADAAVGIVLDAQTSEVLAMASSPNFNPNKSSQFQPERRRNRTITDSFEPGSTMKTFVIAGALSRGLVEPNTRIDCEGGSMRIGRRVIRESDSNHKFQNLTVSEILAFSSNVGTTKIAQKMGEIEVEKTLKEFGFNERSGIDLPGEARGIMQPLPWREHLLANVSFGHGMTATPLQIANAYAAIATDGQLRKPYVVKAVRDAESGEVVETKPTVIRRVLTAEQVAKMRLMLAQVTTGEGTGLNARVPGFPVAGKTGTAQKVNPNGRGYLPGGYISSFAGFLPANDPRFVIYVAVDHPKKGYYGSAVAAPLFSRVAKFAVRRAGLAPVLIGEENVVPRANQKLAQAAKKEVESKVDADLQSGVVPDLAGLTLREVMARIGSERPEIQIRGQGYVTHTKPSAGSRFNDGQSLTVFLSKSH